MPLVVHELYVLRRVKAFMAYIRSYERSGSYCLYHDIHGDFNRVFFFVKMADSIEMPFRMVGLGGPRNDVLEWG